MIRTLWKNLAVGAGFDDDDISVVDVSPDGWVGQRDPMVVVQARKAPAGQMGSLEALA